MLEKTPHCTQRLELLDVGVNALFKNYSANAQDNGPCKNPQ